MGYSIKGVANIVTKYPPGPTIIIITHLFHKPPGITKPPGMNEATGYERNHHNSVPVPSQDKLGGLRQEWHLT